MRVLHSLMKGSFESSVYCVSADVKPSSLHTKHQALLFLEIRLVLTLNQNETKLRGGKRNEQRCYPRRKKSDSEDVNECRMDRIPSEERKVQD